MSVVTHFECPFSDWSEDVEDDIQGYCDLFAHESEMHSDTPKKSA